MSCISKYSSSKHDPTVYLWPMGDTKLCVIDLDSQEFDIVEKLGGYSNEDSLSHCALSSNNGRKVFSLSTSGRDNKCYLNFWAKGMESVSRKAVNELDSGSK